MNGGGGNRRSLTSVAGDTRPAWSPDGRVVVFMSDGRDGNPEIYRADTATGQVARLTNSPSIDALPTVSPDGQWVAYVSNSEGAWKIFAVPLAGGAPQLVGSIRGDLGDWHSQSLQWVR
jgi:TolB protein